jgi:hypothetical protein
MTTGGDFYDSRAALDYLEAEHGLKYTPGYLGKLRHLGKGPRFYIVNNQIAYTPTDLDEYAKSRVVRGPFRKSCEARKSRKNDSAASIDCEVA